MELKFLICPEENWEICPRPASGAGPSYTTGAVTWYISVDNIQQLLLENLLYCLKTVYVYLADELIN